MNLKEFITTLIIGVFKNGMAIGWTIMVSMYPSIAKVLAPFNNELVSQVVATGLGVVVVALLGALYHRAMQNKKVAEIAEAAFDEGGQAMKHAIDVSTGAAASLGDPALWNPPPKAEIKQPGQGGFVTVDLVLWVFLLTACGLYILGCRTVTVNEVPGGGPVYVNQSYAPDITLSALTGLDTNAWKAIAQGAAAGATK